MLHRAGRGGKTVLAISLYTRIGLEEYHHPQDRALCEGGSSVAALHGLGLTNNLAVPHPALPDVGVLVVRRAGPLVAGLGRVEASVRAKIQRLKLKVIRCLAF